MHSSAESGQGQMTTRSIMETDSKPTDRPEGGMADKKEVLDYLRNQQKAAEIEAKVNGVNLWVLLGAMAVVALQLINGVGSPLWGSTELVLRTLAAAEGIYLLSWVLQKSKNSRDEIRYSRGLGDEEDSPYLVLVQGVLLLSPPAALLILVGSSFGTIALALLGLAYLVFGASSIVGQFIARSSKKEKFPKPVFGLTRRADVVGDLVFGAAFIAATTEQVVYLRRLVGGLSVDDAKQLALLATLYLLALLVVRHRLQSASIAWTYELETELVLESVTPDVAIRRIEHRRLGPRLQDVMDRFFDDLDLRSAALDSMLVECKEKVEAAKKVPEEYPAERTSRIKEASERLSVQIDSLVSDCSDFRKYLTKLEEQNTGARKAALAPVLVSLKGRHDSYDNRARSTRLALKRLLE